MNNNQQNLKIKNAAYFSTMNAVFSTYADLQNSTKDIICRDLYANNLFISGGSSGLILTGAININTIGSGLTTIGNTTSPSTTNILGPTNINKTGTHSTTIGNVSGTLTLIG